MWVETIIRPLGLGAWRVLPMEPPGYLAPPTTAPGRDNSRAPIIAGRPLQMHAQSIHGEGVSANDLPNHQQGAGRANNPPGR